jgi:hypothetical protein
LTCDEWLSTHCGTILSNLKYKTTFKTDAILYRRLSEALVRLRTSAKKPLKEMKINARYNGLFYYNVLRLTKAAHPSYWLICGACTGTGRNPEFNNGEPCKSCWGGGYKVKLED